MRSTVAAVVLLCITLGSVAPLSRAAVAGTKPAFDWTQFLKGVKRAADTDVAVPDTEEVDIDYQDSQFQIKPLVSNPMSPFLSMKPFLPTKPTFMPPVVDPQYFIDKKTALLNGLFSPTGPVGGKAMGSAPFGGVMPPNYFAGKKTAFLTTLFNQLATPPPQAVPNVNTTQPADANVIQRRLIAPWLTTPPPVFDPKVMTDKKTAFLDKLFSSFNVATSGDEPVDMTTVKPTIVPPGFWMPLPSKPSVKPTIVPPDFWLPFPALKAADVPVKPTVDASVLVDKKTKFLNDLMSSLNPTEPTPSYDDKVSEFLDRLLEALMTPTLVLKRSLADAESITPDTVPIQAPLDAKDKLTDTFIGELTGIKNNLVDTVAQMIKTQKEAVSPVAAKPGKKAGPPFAGLWGPMAKLKPTPDPTIPFQQKIDVLNQVFDMLTDLRKDVVTAVNAAGLPPTTTMTPVKNATNTTILGLLRKKLMEMDDGTPSKYSVRDADELQKPETRSIKMAVRQGYQSLPPGTTELLQAGGGSSPQGKEGGGISLQIIAPA